MQQQGILLRVRRCEVPRAIAGEPFRLCRDAELGVVGHDHRVGGRAPRRDFMLIDADGIGAVRVPGRDVCGGSQVPCCHEVREDVVVDECGVLVGSGDAVDAKRAFGVVMTNRTPQAGGLDQEFESRPTFEVVVAGGADVAPDRVGDVGVDVEGRQCRPANTPSTPPRELFATGMPLRAVRAAGRASVQGRGWRRANGARRGRRRGRCRSGPAACRSPCPKTCGRRSRGRSDPWPGFRVVRRARPTAAPGTVANRTACCNASSPSISTSA